MATVRTTIVLDEELARRLRLGAARQGVGISRYISDLIRSALNARVTGPEAGYRLEWPTVRGELLPGATIDDRDRLYDIMDGRE